MRSLAAASASAGVLPAVVVVRDAQGDAAAAERRVFQRGDGGARDLDAADQRQHHPLRPDIGDAGDVMRLARRDAHQGRDAAGLQEAEAGLHRLLGEAAVLHVEEGEVAARAGEDMADARGDEFHQEGARRQVARTDHALSVICAMLPPFLHRGTRTAPGICPHSPTMPY